MKASTGCRKDLRGVLTRWARVPLEHRKATLVMREITDRVDEGALPGGLGSARRDMGSTMGAGLGKGSQPVRQALWMGRCLGGTGTLRL